MKGLFVRAKNTVKSNYRDLKEAIRDARTARNTKHYKTNTSTTEVTESGHIRTLTRRNIVGHKITAAQRKFPNQRSGRYLRELFDKHPALR